MRTLAALTTSPSRHHGWLLAATVPFVVLVAWYLVGSPGPEWLRFPRGLVYETSLVADAGAAVAAAACLIGIRHPVLAFVVLAGLSFGAAAAWPLMVDNVHAGEVVFDIAGTHGVHRNDLLSVVPFTAGVVFLGAAVKQRSRVRHEPTEVATGR